jgi:hypothetical protein
MGSHFFKAGGAPKSNLMGGAGGGGLSAAVRSVGFASRGAGSAAQKSLGAAAAINKAGKYGPSQRSSAYPKGPKV